MRWYEYVCEYLVLWVALAAVIGIFTPSHIGTLMSTTVPIQLFIMIFGIGLTLTLSDLVRAMSELRIVGMALLFQLLTIPTAGFLTYKFLEGDVAVGMAVIASTPSEITSSLMVYLSGGDVALGTTVMASSILLYTFLTPLLIEWITGSSIAFEPLNMLFELIFMVALPLILASTLRTKHSKIEKYHDTYPAISAIAVIVLIFTVSANAVGIITFDLLLVYVPMCLILNLWGYLSGYVIGKIMHSPPTITRVFIFTNGMREFGIGTAISLSFFNPAVAIASAIYGIIMMLTSATLTRLIRLDN